MIEINDYVGNEENLKTCTKKELIELVITFHKSLSKIDDLLKESIIDKQFYRKQLSDNYKEHKKKEDWWKLRDQMQSQQIEELKRSKKSTVN